ncbi:pentapeptide repeat-containing protein [Paenibacillus athensensis]|uniref:Pentapeptide repeat-containing protein n=1 Tax=Paenibacillus athensensis TaxID=1967502 RepID=A0A4Y8PX39_9BACL|nr:pentapeptide repeat-containing protein [Paenibacillus athensensis]MCD1257842.1 pentapeptide repeat-containing protein [Paenibacillus athensensis]
MPADSMVFIGKWTFSNTGVNTFLSLDESSGQLVGVSTSSAGSDQRFNAYGDKTSGFWLQAANGKYIVYNGSAYVSSEQRSGNPATFTLVTSGSNVYLAEQSSGSTYYVNMDGTAVNRVSSSNPPATTLLVQVSITPGLAQIQQASVLHSADLTWVYMESADLSYVDFSGSNLTHADLSHANLFEATLQGTDTILSQAVFANAQMNYTIMPNCTATGADFSNAVMKFVVLSDANLSSSTFIGTNLTDASLDSANLTGASMANVNLYGAIVIGTNFTQADLSGANLLLANIDSFHIPGATLSGANLNNQDLTRAEIDAHTNFTSASMQNVRLNNCALNGVTFTHADLTGALFDGSDLTGADLSFATLTNASLKNGVKLFSASLSNSTLTGANLTGAQLGAKQEAFTLSTSLVTDLDSGAITPAIQQAFQAAGHPLSPAATLTVRIPGQNWVITDVNTVYTITNDGTQLNVWMYDSSNDAAVLAGAYMPNAIFTDANLYAVNMSGVNWYGDAAKADNADLEEADLANANLASMDLSQARMFGCNLDSANLIGTIMNGASLTPSFNKKQASLAFSNMQGTSFQQARLQDTVLTNAAVSLNEGPFFSLPSSYASSLDSQTISSDLRSQFAANNYPLASNATVQVVTLGTYWTITNTGDTIYPIYTIVKIGTTLYVSGGPIGVHLFDLPGTMTTEFNQQILGQDIQTAFSNNGYPLLSSAKIDQVIIPDHKWHMTNISTDTTQLQKGYVEFYVISNADGMLHVYGSVLMVIRPDSTGTLEQVRFALATTQMTQDVMDGTTTCPNGQKLSQYLNQTPPQHLTWEQMMTAATPPKPPSCVPDPWHWC